MSQQQLSRRDVLKTATAVAAAPSLAGIPAAAQNEKPAGDGALRRIDQILRQAAESKASPGIVAVAATDRGVIYEGASRRCRPISTSIWCSTITHRAPPVKAWLARHRRYQLHFTPTSASWLNQIERWFALFADKQSIAVSNNSRPISPLFGLAIASGHGLGVGLARLLLVWCRLPLCFFHRSGDPAEHRRLGADP